MSTLPAVPTTRNGVSPAARSDEIATEAASYAEVIRNALKLYDGLITEAEAGAAFLVRGANGDVSPFKMFL